MDIVVRPLPSGVVTLVLGDLEGSVGLWERDSESMTAAMVCADELVDEFAERFVGVQPTAQGEGDNFVVAFDRVSDALSCACEIQRRFTAEPWPGGLDLRFRIGVHTGEITIDASNRYEGPTINRCARIRDLGRGGQILLSGATAALAADAIPEGATTRYLGAHELRSMARPEDLHQLLHPDLDDSFPTIASSVTSNLPTPASSFVGRSVELAELQDLLATSRVVTITGAGGSGKSRLSVELARAQPTTRSRWLVELAPVRDPLLVPRSVADAVGADVAGGTDPVDAIVRKLGGRTSLLVLDNCEHLLEACAGLASTLVQGCPGLAVVATSREPLAIDGEVIWRIPSLTMPDAVTLFVDRARRADTSFDLTEATAGPVAEICQRVDRLPLAIELAAARCRVLSVEQIATSLRERFRLLTGGTRDALPRQRSLEASVAWSYDLLPDVERTVLARLSVFAGSFGLDGATLVAAGGHVEADQVLDAVSSLVDRSLVQVEHADDLVRYRLLETIRAYTRERLTEIDDPNEVRDRHLDFALQLATTGGAGFLVDAARWGPILKLELDNLRSAIEWAGSSGRPEQVVDLIADLAVFWSTRSMHRELDRALRSVIFSDELTAPARARGMAVAVPLATYGGDFSAGFDFANDACAFSEKPGDSGGLRAWATTMRAWAGVGSGRGTNKQISADIETALAAVDRCDPATAATLLGHIGGVQVLWSSVPAGRATFERAIQIAQEQHAVVAEYAARVWMLSAGTDGDVQAFRDNAETVVGIARTLRSDFLLSGCLQYVGYTEALLGHERAARQHVTEALEVTARLGSVFMEYIAFRADALVEVRFGNPRLASTKASDALVRAQQMRLGINERIDEWLVGAAARRAGDSDQAREHFESALALSTDPAVPFVTGRALLGLALLDLAEDDIGSAWQHGHDSLDVLVDAGDRIGALDALDVIAAVAARSDTAETAARLSGAADACRERLGISPFMMNPDERLAVTDALAAKVDDVEMHRTDGAQLTFDDVVAYARRGRGDRNRPTTGWQSLTPTEINVVRLVAEGLQNAQIAAKLLMSINTVKTHLSHAYTKLGISSRTELAAQATTHRL